MVPSMNRCMKLIGSSTSGLRTQRSCVRHLFHFLPVKELINPSPSSDHSHCRLLKPTGQSIFLHPTFKISPSRRSYFFDKGYFRRLPPPAQILLAYPKSLIRRAAEPIPCIFKAKCYSSLLKFYSCRIGIKQLGCCVTDMNDFVVNTLLFNAEDEIGTRRGQRGQPPSISGSQLRRPRRLERREQMGIRVWQGPAFTKKEVLEVDSDSDSSHSLLSDESTSAT